MLAPEAPGSCSLPRAHWTVPAVCHRPPSHHRAARSSLCLYMSSSSYWNVPLPLSSRQTPSGLVPSLGIFWGCSWHREVLTPLQLLGIAPRPPCSTLATLAFVICLLGSPGDSKSRRPYSIVFHPGSSPEQAQSVKTSFCTRCSGTPGGRAMTWLCMAGAKAGLMELVGISRN